MSARLAGKVALVTGATDGIGAAITRRFAAEGARLVLVARRPGPGAALVEELGDDCIFVAGDVALPLTAARAVAAAEEHFGSLDVLVNNAGIDHSGVAFLDASLADAERVFAVNVFGALMMMQAATRSMMERRSGSIVNVTSRTAMVGVPTMSIYGASKGALLSLTKATAVELAGDGIRVNAVAPGPTDTALMRRWIGEHADPVGFRAALESTIPVGRLAAADEVAAAVLYLASDEARYVTGASLAIDGGYVAG